MNSHYDYLEKNFPKFAREVGLKDFEDTDIHWLNSSHGDKAYGYCDRWEKAGIPFEKGVAIFLLSYFSPWSNEVRQTENGWVDVCNWVISKKDEFLPLLPDYE